jgi:uncharacterized membrane protein YdjX (TVP38/TMEM64 family)
MRRFNYEIPDMGKRKKGAVRFTLAVKFAPGIPAFVKNYGLGVASVPFPLYFIFSMLVTGAYAVLLVVLGESLLNHQLNRTVVLIASIALVALGAWWWRRRRRAAS